MTHKRLSERTRDKFVFLCSYIEDILILFGLVSIIVSAYLYDVKMGLLVQGLAFVWLGFVLSKILK